MKRHSMILVIFLVGCMPAQPLTVETPLAGYTQTAVHGTTSAIAMMTDVAKNKTATMSAEQTKDANDPYYVYTIAAKTVDAQSTAEKQAQDSSNVADDPTPFPNPILDKGCCGFPGCPYSEPKIGMTGEQVRLICGYPAKVNRTTTAYGESEQWVLTYGLNNIDMYLYFENGILTTIQD
jgi:hypothetical protein